MDVNDGGVVVDVIDVVVGMVSPAKSMETDQNCYANISLAILKLKITYFHKNMNGNLLK